MEQTDKVKFSVRLRNRSEVITRTDSREAFWTEFFERIDGLEPDLEIDTLERRVLANLPYTLKEYLGGLATGGRAHLANLVQFEVTALRYSSLDLTLAVRPVGALVQLFEGHFDYFQMFLQSYLPLAFVDAVRLPQSPPGIDWQGLARQLDVQLIDASELSDRFRAGLIRPESHSTRQRAANWLWVASNTSLLVPTLIALIFLYLAWQSLEERSKSVDRAYQALIQTQTQLLQGYFPLVRSTVAESLPVATPKPR